MFHTDRGSQFTCSDFRKEIDSLNMVQSFSAKRHPYDNAVMECFFKYLKKEELDRRCFQSLEQLKLSQFLTSPVYAILFVLIPITMVFLLINLKIFNFFGFYLSTLLTIVQSGACQKK